MDATKRLRLQSHPNRTDRIHAQGFTLHEALVSLTLVGILSVGAIGFTRLIQASRIATDVNTLVADLSLARSEAIKRAQPVTICKSNTGSSCNNAAQWHAGRIIFADTNESGELDDGEDVVRVGQKLRRGLSLSYSAFGPGLSNYIIYQPSGMTKSQNGTFRFCDSTTARTVILYKTGRVRTSTTEADGDPIDCP
jgi:type IV fimbrial biogenesis protein FimT